MSFAGADFAQLTLAGAKSQLKIETLILSRVVVHSALNLSEAHIHHLVAPSMRVLGPANLTRVKIMSTLDLRFSQLATLDWTPVDIPQRQGSAVSDKQQISIDGLQYDEITTNERDDPESMLRLLKDADFNTESYVQFEKYLAARGNVEGSDVVHALMKRRQAAYQTATSRWWRVWPVLLFDFILSGHPKPANDGHLKTGKRE